MRRITFVIVLGALIVMVLLASCKPAGPRGSPNQSPLLSPLPTVTVPPTPPTTIYPTIVVSYVILPTPTAIPGPRTIITASGGYTGHVPTSTVVIVPWTPGPSPTPLPQVHPFGANGVQVDLRPINETVPIHVGQQLVVKASPDAESFAYTGWDVVYDATVLQLAADVNLTRPPAIGWMWLVRNTGTTTITFKTKVSPCTIQPCPDFTSYRADLVLQISP